MENELRCLLSGMEERIVSLRSMRSVSEQKDAVNAIVRDALGASMLCRMDGELYSYEGRCYERVSERRVRETVLNLMSDMGVGASLLGMINGTPWAVLGRKERALDRTKVCLANGVYDTVRCCAMPFSPDVMTDYMLPYALDVDAPCPMWERFLSEVLPDESVRMNLQEFFGMCFIDRRRLSVEKFAMLVGSGANGKSVVCEVVKRVLGGDARVDNLSPDQIQDPKQVVSLRGKVLNIAPDVRRASSFSSAMKALSSGQTVKGWEIYSGGVDIVCPPLCFAMNDVPNFSDPTNAMHRRVLLFPFDVTIPRERQDRMLADRLYREEACGILMWIMRGARRLRESGGLFTRSDVMDAARDQLFDTIRTEQSPVLSFLDEHGLSVNPVHDGQKPVAVTAGFIYEGLGGKLKKTGITKELRRYGVRSDRGRETRYYLYRKEYGEQ